MRDWLILRHKGAPIQAKYALLARRSAAEPYIRRICVLHGLTPALLLSRSRRRTVAYARQDLMLALREDGWSLPQIGHVLDRNHTTIMQGVEAAQYRKRKLGRVTEVMPSYVHGHSLRVGTNGGPGDRQH